MRRSKPVTLRDIAAELELTVHTVSKALRGLPGMSERTRQEVIEKAKELGYHTKEQERSMAVERIPYHSVKQRRFMMLLNEDSHFNRLMLTGVQERMIEFGHSVHPVVVPPASSVKLFREWMKRHELDYCDGLFLSPVLPPVAESELLSQPVPKIMLNFPPHTVEVDSVVWDVYHAVHQSVRYFISKGHRRIMYVGDIESHRGFRLRWQGFQEAMNEAGLTVDPKAHMTAPPPTKEQWIEELREKLTETKPTAILCALQRDPAWFYYACSTIGLSIPEDVSLVSLEHERPSFFPELTRPILLVKEAGERAAERMLWRIANPGAPYEHIRLQGAFYEGETVRALRGKR
ncbi:LacI family DNA-binding transcriptional regulator [Paenibacillus sp. GD4]|uniref:LacI family DNA-binding transcriptional regulator n=1 Tax=Paenibacillus sp. GD4 TaxID=3068890 RepID=UPI002796B42B|nr:LacI family DNA-binding transcriptional regulator [Paenibacillus sp. GD4]MDQ1910303.1 LacI family DNA-binding transcriptional regulator [Paenibacillus sp. GD4]